MRLFKITLTYCSFIEQTDCDSSSYFRIIIFNIRKQMNADRPVSAAIREAAVPRAEGAREALLSAYSYRYQHVSGVIPPPIVINPHTSSLAIELPALIPGPLENKSTSRLTLLHGDIPEARVQQR
jgi:hypothetical protein